MPPALDLNKFKKTTPTVQKPVPTATGAKQPLDINSFKVSAPSNSANMPTRNIASMSGGYLRSAIPRITGAVAEDVKNAYEGVKKSGIAAQVSSERGDLAGAVGNTLRAGTRAAAGGARAIFEPVLIPLSDAISKVAEKTSDMPSVQKIAMSDKVGRILDRAKDTSISLGQFSKDNPDLAQDAKDITDIILTIAGTKVTGATLKGVAGAAERTAARVESSLGGTAARLGAERTLGAAEKDAASILTRKATEAVTPDVAATFQKYGIEPPISAVSGSKAVQGAEAYAQTSFFGGRAVTEIIEKSRQEIGKVAETLRKNVDAEKLKTTGVTAESVGRELQTALKKTEDAFNDAKTKVYDEATKMIGSQQAVLDETRAALEDIIRQKSASLDPSAKATTKYYEELLRGTGDAKKRTYVNIKQTRTDIGRKLKNPTDPITTGDRASLSRLYAALSNDLEKTVTQSSKEAAAALKYANAYYKAGIEQINSVVGRTIFRSKSPETLVGKLITPGNVSAVRNLKTIVGPEAFHQVGSMFMNNIVDAIVSPLTGRLNAGKLSTLMAKYGDDTLREVLGERGLKQLQDLRKRAIVDDILERGTADGKVQPGRLQQAIESYDEKVLKEAFTPEELAKLKDVREMSGAIAKGTKMADGSPTAEKAQMGVNVVLGLVNVPTLLTKIGIDWGVAKLFTSPWGRKLMSGGKVGKKGGTQPVSREPIATEAEQAAKTGGSVTRYSERVEGEAAKAPERKPTRYTGTEAFGIAGGVQPDEEGNVKFNPLAAAGGLALGVAGRKASRAMKKIPVDDRNVMRDFTDMVAGDYRPDEKARKALQLDAQRIADHYGIKRSTGSDKALANEFGRVLEGAEDVVRPLTKESQKERAKLFPKKPKPGEQGRDDGGRYTSKK